MASCECDDTPDTRFTLQKPNDSATAPASGIIDLSSDANWITVGRPWGRVITRGGRENWRFRQVEAEVSRIVRLGWNSTTRAISPRWRLRYTEYQGKTVTLDIASAYDVDNKHQIIEANCIEVVPP